MVLEKPAAPVETPPSKRAAKRQPPTPINLDQLEAKILGRQAGMHWYTLVIEPQSWRRVAERAREIGYETYCPMARFRPQYGRPGKPMTPIERPLLGGYMFVDMPAAEKRFDLFQRDADSPEAIRGCRGVLSSSDGPLPLHDDLIQSMRLRELNGEFDFTASSGLPKWAKMGRRVELNDGPFAGKFARILSPAKGLVRVLMFLFGQEMPIDVPISWLSPA